MHAVYRLLIIATSVYIITAAVLFFKQTSYIYFPDNRDFYACAYFSDEEKIEHNGTRMYYKQNGEKLVVLYHGNAGSACDRTLYASYFDAHDISYLLVEYAGYAGDTREPSRKLLLEDTEHVVDMLKTLKYETVVVLGESVGTGIATHHMKLQEPDLSRKGKAEVDKLILVSPFTRLSDVAKIHYPWYPVKLALREEYDNISSLSDYTGELLIIHGTDDQIIPYEMSERLYDQASQATTKELMPIDGAGHNDLFAYDEMFEKITEFVLK